jgi:site-specific DNA recombinase
MVGGIYARKSTKQDGDPAALSVARQIETARAFAIAHGWTIDESRVFSDVESGAEFSRRPGLVRLLAALKPTPSFAGLLVTDRDRIGREQIEASFVLKTLIQAGVKVFEVSKKTAHEITLSSPTDKVLASVTGFAAEMERAQAAVRTHAALLHRAQTGAAVSGPCFGYANVCAACNTPRTPRPCGCKALKRRVVVAAEAAVVREIFKRIIEGHGVKAIARDLNAEHALAPKKAGRMSGWTPSSVRGVLHNRLYRGEVVWNRSKKRDAWGQRNKSQRDAGDVVTVQVGDARVIDDALWTAAHAKLAVSRRLFASKYAGELAAGRPSGSRSPHLLGGLGACAICGGSMFVHKLPRNRSRWGCASRHLRGQAVCANGLSTDLTDTENAVLTAVETSARRAGVGDGHGESARRLRGRAGAGRGGAGAPGPGDGRGRAGATDDRDRGRWAPRIAPDGPQARRAAGPSAWP